MKWLRYKHKWAHGSDCEWTYLRLSDYQYANFFAEGSEQTEEDFIEEYELCSDWNYSDKYRGIDYEVVDRAPRKFIEKSIKNAKAMAVHYNEVVKKLTKELESYEL